MIVADITEPATTSIIKAFDFVISAIGFMGEKYELALVNAVVSAGVYRFFPLAIGH